MKLTKANSKALNILLVKMLNNKTDNMTFCVKNDNKNFIFRLILDDIIKKSNSKYRSQKVPLILYDRERGCGYTLQRPYETIYATFDEFKQNWYKEHSIDTGSKEVEYRYRQYELEKKNLRVDI